MEELAKKTGFDHLTGTVAFYNSYCEKIQKKGFFSITIHAKSIVDMFLEANSSEHNEEYEVLL